MTSEERKARQAGSKAPTPIGMSTTPSPIHLEVASATLSNQQVAVKHDKAVSPKVRKQTARENKDSIPPRTIDPEEEDEIIRMLEIEQKRRLEEDPMRELEEALMDRTTASHNRRQKITSLQFNSSNYPEPGPSPMVFEVSGSRKKRKMRNQGDASDSSGGYR